MNQQPSEKTILTCESSSCTHSSCTHCISWSAIIVPALVAIGLSFLLYVLTIGLGLSVFTLNTEGQLSLAMGSFIWLVISTYVIMFLVGWIAGALVRPHRCSGVLHGFTAWCLALIVTAALFSQGTATVLGTPTYYSLKSPTTASQVSTQVRIATSSTTTTEAVNKLGVGVLAIFFVFVAGALGSCCGGYVGSELKDKNKL